MSKPFRSHNQQLKILRKRNMIVSNGAKAKAILVRENYYLLINGYKDIFLDLVETEKPMLIKHRLAILILIIFALMIVKLRLSLLQFFLML